MSTVAQQMVLSSSLNRAMFVALMLWLDINPHMSEFLTYLFISGLAG